MKKTSPIELGESHKRGIASKLVLLDEALCTFEQWATGREVRSVVYEERNDLSPEQREKILAEVERTRALLREIRDALGLGKYVQRAGEAIWSYCSGLWENVVELEPKHLRRYGEPPAALCEFLEPKISQLVKHLQRISNATRKWDGAGERLRARTP